MCDKKWAEDVLSKIANKVEAECGRVKDGLPFIALEGRFENYGKVDVSWWTNGFWGGILWQLYNTTGNNTFRKVAEKLEETMDANFENFPCLHHDVGFMWSHTAVANYRLTGNEKSLHRGLHAASVLAGRYNPVAKFINAWNAPQMCYMIVDCMMNLPLLYWAKDINDLGYYEHIAKEHADKTLNTLVRGDGSVHHMSIMDPITGAALEFPMGQGYESGSSWSRGHGWAIYGYALSYRYTKEVRYLDAAKNVAHYFMANIAKEGYIPLIDFRAPKEPKLYDTSAGLTAACGMLEIAEYVGEHEKALYEDTAKNIVHAIAEKYADYNPDTDGLVGGASESYNGPHIHVPIIYGDYFFVEAVLRLAGKHFMIW